MFLVVLDTGLGTNWVVLYYGISRGIFFVVDGLALLALDFFISFWYYLISRTF